MISRVIQGFFPCGQPGQGRLVQRKTGAASSSSLKHAGQPNYLEVDSAQLGLVNGGGHALGEPIRRKMEAALGADFSSVRVHVGPQASRIGAVAFTLGNDIYFAHGQFSPDTAQGQQLLGHELAHVIQQRQGRVSSPGAAGLVISLDQSLEAEASRLGQMAAQYTGPTSEPKSETIMRSVASPMPMANTAVALQQKPMGAMAAGALPQQTAMRSTQGAISGQSSASRGMNQRFFIQRSSAGIGGAQSIRLTGPNSPKQIGSLQLWTKGNGVVELTDMHVERDFRRQGAGKALMSAALQCARIQGASTVRLEAAPYDGGMSTQSLAAMYQRMGFQAAGISGRGYPVLQRQVNAAFSFKPMHQRSQGRMGRGALQAKMMPAGGGLLRGRVIQRAQQWEFVSGFVDDIKDSYNGRNDSGVVFGTVQHRPPRTYGPSEVEARFLRLVSNYFFWYANTICTKDEAEVECMWVNDRLFVSANNTQTMKQIFEHMKQEEDLSEALRSAWTGDRRGVEMMDTFNDIYQSPDTTSDVAHLLQGLSFDAVDEVVRLIPVKGVGEAITHASCSQKILLVSGYSHHAEQKLMVGLASSTLPKQSPIVIRGKKRPCFGCWLGLCFVSEVLGYTNLQFNKYQGKAWVGSVKTLGSLYTAARQKGISKQKIEQWIEAKNSEAGTKKTHVTIFDGVEDPGYDSGSDHES